MREFMELWKRFASTGDIPSIEAMDRAADAAIREFDDLRARLEGLEQRVERGPEYFKPPSARTARRLPEAVPQWRRG